jgi:hypothetical protein
MCGGAGTNLVDRRALSLAPSVLSGNCGGGGHDIMEAPLNLVDSMVSKLRLSDSDEWEEQHD